MKPYDTAGQDQKILVYIDPDLEEIIPQFLENARNDAQAMREALQRGEYETLQRMGHSMKGVGGFGFDFLNEVGLSLEQAAKAQDFAEVQTLVDDLTDYLKLVEPVYT